MATVPRLQRYYQDATTSCPRMSFGSLISPAGSLISPAGSASACRGSCPPWALPPSCRPGGGPGSGLFALAVPFQRSCPRARAGSPRFPGDPSHDFAPVHDPGRPVAPRQYRRFRCCPHRVNGEGVVVFQYRGCATLRRLLSTLHDTRCHAPCKTRFRLAGCAFAGRELNPLDRYERFQVISSPSPGLCLAR